ncbi:MAG: hypothetical protein AB1505_12665 [Candidatus Latescibacterota bacterium]
MAAPRARAQPQLLFEELFEDEEWEGRGWYDGPNMVTTAEEHIAGSTRSCVWHWARAGDTSPQGRGARARLRPVNEVTLTFHIKHSADWTWTGVPWHPHEFNFVTTEDDDYVGPARTHLTFYVEAVNGVPRVAIQDGANIDEARAGEDLTGVTEARAVAGCNGDADGHGDGDCYVAGDNHANGKVWEAALVWFADEPGPRHKAAWHQVTAHLRLNSVQDGKGQRDGLLQYWQDGVLLLDHDDVVFRTGQHPDLLIDQFLMLPYYGPGVPHPQTIWVDDLRIWAGPPPSLPTPVPQGDSTWGTVKRPRHRAERRPKRGQGCGRMAEAFVQRARAGARSPTDSASRGDAQKEGDAATARRSRATPARPWAWGSEDSAR